VPPTTTPATRTPRPPVASIPRLPPMPATAAGNTPGHSAAPGQGSGEAPPANGPKTPKPTSTGTTAGNPSRPDEFPPASQHSDAEQAAKNAVGSGADDSLLLAVLLLGFTLAVGGMVLIAGRRGGRRVH